MNGSRSDGRARRDALLDAALRCFERRGLLATGIEQIRREAGASPSSVYHLFADREALIVALLLRTFARLFATLGSELIRTRSARGAVESLVRAHIAWMLDNPGEARFMYQATALEFSASAGKQLREEKAKLVRPLVDVFARHIASGRLPAWSPIELDVVLLGPSHEACRRYLAGAELDPDWLRATLPGLAYRSVARRARTPRQGRTMSKTK